MNICIDLSPFIQLAAIAAVMCAAFCVLVLFADRVLPRFLPKRFDPKIKGED